MCEKEVLKCVKKIHNVSDTYLSRFFAHPIQVLVIGCQQSIVSPWIDNILSVTVERYGRSKFARKSLHELLLGASLALRKRRGANKCLVTWQMRRTLVAPVIAIVAIQIDADTSTSCAGISVFAPQSIGRVRILVPIGIGQRKKEPVY